jgi:hypothetical protein
MDLGKKLVILLILFCFVSCGTRDAALMRTKTMNGIKYELHYVPKESFQDPAIADLAYYKLVISEETHNGKINELFKQQNYNKLLYYINSSLNKDLAGYYDNQQSKLVQVYFESNNRMSKSLVFMLAFEKSKNSDKTFSFAFNDNIFNNGPIKLQYDLKDLKTF